MKTFRATALALLSAVFLYACGSSGSQASSSSGLTQSQVQTLIAQALAPVQQQVSTLQSQVSALQGSATPAVFIRAPNAPAIAIKAQARGTSQKATAPTCTGLGTLTGRPTDSDPLATDDISGVSCTGYYFTVSGAATSAQSADIQGPPSGVRVWFDAPNCTGNAYVTINPSGGLSQGALANGAVFTIGDPTVAANYLMLKPGTASSQPNLQSDLQNGACTNTAVSQLVVYPLVTNDSTVSGVPSAPIAGPVTIG